jgi:hypothetical protein
MTIYPKELQPILDRIDPTFGRFIDCDSGWWPLIGELHQKALEIDPDYRIYQIKEKFGALRFYFSASNPLLSANIQQIVDSYEKKSTTVCEKTGQEGCLMRKDGIFKTLNSSFINEGWKEVGSF